MRWRLPAAICLAALVPLTAGCGSSRNDASDTNALLGTLRSLKPGEILIIGKRSPRTAGPFSFEAGGYLLRFTQPRGAHLRVSVRSSTSTGSDAERLLTDTTRARGAEHVDIAGRLYVRVVASAHSYTLRFTPRGD
jgi:hypothetical protein